MIRNKKIIQMMLFLFFLFLSCEFLSYVRLEHYRKHGIVLSFNGEERSQMNQKCVELKKNEASKRAIILSYLSRQLGKKYSQKNRDNKGYFDCSSLAYYACKKAGINIAMDGVYTAASEAKWFEKNAEMVTLENLREGDFIFYCFGKNQRYKNIDHVAIYVGDGKVIDASMSIGYVVYRDLYDIDKISVIGRVS